MPNWCWIELEAEGICKDERFFTWKTEVLDEGKMLEVGTKYLDFNKIIPEPATKEECVKKYGEKYIDNDDHYLQHSDESRKWFNWYQWHCDFWGTKWNACDVKYYDEDDLITFQTAWAFPTPVIKKISEMMPGIEVKCTVEHEFNGGIDTVIYLNGQMKSATNSEEAAYYGG